MPVKQPPRPIPIQPPNKVYPYDHTNRNLAYRIAVAADKESLWCKDISKFPDLLIKYSLPSSISEHTIHQAESITRQFTTNMIEAINERGRTVHKAPNPSRRKIVPKRPIKTS